MSIELVVGSFPEKNKAAEVFEHLEQLAEIGRAHV